VKIAEINAVARAVMKAGHMPVRDQIISRTTWMGRVMTPVAPLANLVLKWGLVRWVMERVVGIHRRAAMPRAQRRTFAWWWRRHRSPGGWRGKIVFFHGCAGQYFEVETSIKTVEVLEHLGFEVVVPKQGCCGLALQSNGLFGAAERSVRALAEALNVEGEVPIVTSAASCAGMLKHEAREVMGVEDGLVAQVAARVREVSEFLLELAEAGELPRFRAVEARLAYHAPCQLKSQGMGKPALEVLRLIPGLEVVDAQATCCGIAGTYGFKKEKWAIGQAVGKELFDRVVEINPGLAACDTETCRWQIAASTGAQVVHPIWLIHRGLGLS
jgi:glycerol-3-phosphate dehydrogenase subunit C